MIDLAISLIHEGYFDNGHSYSVVLFSVFTGYKKLTLKNLENIKIKNKL